MPAFFMATFKRWNALNLSELLHVPILAWWIAGQISGQLAAV
ncbi:hypothetical protein CSC05_5272 [Escherichia coli]|nr:hypothetical protein CSC05_5272 [Escherichia coli]